MTGGLHAKLELPEEDEALVGRRVTVSGWAVYQAKPVLAVAVTLVGPLWTRTELATSNSRADVAEHFGADTDMVGWEASFDVEEADAWCEFETCATVWGAIGLMPESTELRSFCVGPSSPAPLAIRGALEHPSAEHWLTVRDVLYVRGWAASNHGPIDEVEIRLDGRSVGLARLGLHRPDLVSELAHSAAQLSGFEHYVDLEGFPLRSNSLTVEAVARLDTQTVSLGQRKIVVSPSRHLLEDRVSRREAVLQQRTAELVASMPAPPADGALNLLVVTHDLGYGGAQLWLSELLDKSGAGRDFRCTVLSRAAGPLVGVLERSGIDVHVRDEYTLRNIELYEAQVAELAVWSRTLGHNAVLVNTMGSFVGADLAERLGLACVWAIHESWPPSEYWKVNFPKGWVDARVRAAAHRSLSRCPAVVFETKATQALFHGAVEPESSLVIPYGVDLAEIDTFAATVTRESARHELNVPPGARLLLLLGTIEPRKAQTVLAESFERVAQKYPDAILALVGDQSTPYSASLKEYLTASRLDLGGRVRVEPVTKDIYPWYRAADVFVCASDVESLPRSVLEAMAFGVPVAATAVFGLPELIEDGKSGWLFGPRSVGEATRTLDRILSLDGRLLADVGSAAVAIVRERHDSRDYSRQIVALLNHLRIDRESDAATILGRLPDARATSGSR